MTPRVTFVVPCYNYGRYVAEAMDSLLEQSLKALEVIAINDASTDNTSDVLARYRQDPRVKIIEHEKNLGHIATFNEGLAQARGEFVGLLSADDLALKPDAATRQVRVFDDHPCVGMVFTATAILTGDRIDAYTIPVDHDYVRSGLDEFRQLMWGDYIPASGTLIRADLQAELGLYEPSLKHNGDWDMWMRACTRRDVGYIADPIYGYRMHASNMSHVTVPPWQATNELLRTLGRAFAALPEDAPADILAAQREVRYQALLHTAYVDMFYRRTRRAWQGSVHAVRTDPRVVLSPRFWKFLPRLAASTALDQGTFVRLVSLMERLRGRTEPSTASIRPA